VSAGADRVVSMTKRRPVFTCSACGRRSSQWAGRCAACGDWGTLEEQIGPVEPGGAAALGLVGLGAAPGVDRRVCTGFEGMDRVMGGGIVPASVSLLAGEPGIGKSTLLLHVVAQVAAQGLGCVLVSGEESHAQVAARAARLGLAGADVAFAPGRDLEQVLATALAAEPFLLAVDSIQTVRDTSGSQMPGGVSQVRTCTDALVGLAKSKGITVLMTGHVTKDGDLAGPRSLEHAVDVVLNFDGDLRSGMRVLAGGKNRFGAEGETAWFEMGSEGLREIDPTALLVSGERLPGAATALPRSGRRALAVEVQALVGTSEGPARRQATGLDLRRFQLVAAVLDRVAGIPLGRSELFGASAGGLRLDDPAADLAVAVALASAQTGRPAPEGSAFVGELSLTGTVRAASAFAQRVAAARAAGLGVVFASPPAGYEPSTDVRVVPVHDVGEAVARALSPADPHRRSA
jgi:DNA repair protein RadA/Sms